MIDTELPASSATRIFAFCAPEPGSAATYFNKHTAARRARPDRRHVAVVGVQDQPAERLHPHRSQRIVRSGSSAAGSRLVGLSAAHHHGWYAARLNEPGNVLGVAGQDAVARTDEQGDRRVNHIGGTGATK